MPDERNSIKSTFVQLVRVDSPVSRRPVCLSTLFYYQSFTGVCKTAKPSSHNRKTETDLVGLAAFPDDSTMRLIDTI